MHTHPAGGALGGDRPGGRVLNGLRRAGHLRRNRAAQTKLSELVVKPAGTTTGYSRDKFSHWSDAQENGWVLVR